MLIGTRHNGTEAVIDTCEFGEFGDSTSDSGEFDDC